MQLPHNFPDVVISAFTPFRNKEGNIVPGVKPKKALLYRELFRFKEGYYMMLIESLRSLATKVERDKFKLENLPAFTVSCAFKENDYRKQSNIESYTNLLCFDVDYSGAADFIGKQKESNINYSMADLRDAIYKDIPCVYAGISCSGEGVFYIVQYSQGEHEDCFLDMQDYMKEKYGIQIDAACKDFARLRFATFDSGSHITPYPEIKPWVIRKEYLEKKQKLEEYRKSEKNKIVVHHTTDVAGVIMERALNMIRSSREGERHNKIRAASRLLGGYVASNLLDEGYVQDKLMQTVVDINYDDTKDAQKAIDYGLNAGKLNPLEVNIITPDDPQFNFFVEQDEIRQREIKNLYNEIHGHIRAGTPITMLDLIDLGTRFLIDTERIQDIAYRLYEKFSYEFGIDFKPVISKVEAYMTGKYQFRRDIITDTIEHRQIGMHDWYPVRYENMWREIASVGYRFKFEDLVRLFRSNYVPDVNIWDDFFRSIPRDGAGFDHIQYMAKHVKMQDPDEQGYFELMFKKMLVRTIKCALDDNYANRCVFVFASETQSNGKSSLIRWLNPFGAHQYYAENPLEDNKDARIRLAETFLYNLEELATISKFEINRLKATISQIGTRDRKPYGRQAENIIRRCSFFGSTNRTTFLTDDKNTRWLCFEVGKIDWKYASNVDKKQMWAQAYDLYKSGYDCELSEEEAETRDNKNERFSISFIEQDLLSKYFEPAMTTKEPGVQFLTSTTILERLLILTKESRMQVNSVWLGRAMNRLGYKRVRKGNTYGYYVIEKNRPAYSSFGNDDTPDNLDIEIPF